MLTGSRPKELLVATLASLVINYFPLEGYIYAIKIYLSRKARISSVCFILRSREWCLVTALLLLRKNHLKNGCVFMSIFLCVCVCVDLSSIA